MEEGAGCPLSLSLDILFYALSMDAPPPPRVRPTRADPVPTPPLPPPRHSVHFVHCGKGTGKSRCISSKSVHIGLKILDELEKGTHSCLLLKYLSALQPHPLRRVCLFSQPLNPHFFFCSPPQLPYPSPLANTTEPTPPTNTIHRRLHDTTMMMLELRVLNTLHNPQTLSDLL